jgi:hypothetical protein
LAPYHDGRTLDTTYEAGEGALSSLA